MPYLGRSPGSGVRTRFIYAATAGQTSFSGNDSNSVSLAYEDTLYMDVYQNGVLLKPVTDYAATTGTSVVLVTGATTDDVVEMIVYDTFAVADTVSAKDGGTFAGNVAMGGTLDVTGAITSSAGATITTADNTAQLILKSTDADASVGPLFQLHRDSSSPADDDAMGTIDFRGENSASEVINYVRINTRSADVTDGTEDAKFDVNTYVAGASVNRFSMTPTETVFNEDSVDVDFRVEGNGDANLLYVDAGNDRIGIGTASPSELLDLYSGSTNARIQVQTNNSSSVPAIEFRNTAAGCLIGMPANVNAMTFTTADNERMRLTAGGNLNIGKSDDGFGTAGLGLRGDADVAQFTRSGDSPLELNRLSNDGDLIGIYKDSSSVGSIGVNTDRVYLSTANRGIAIDESGGTLLPCLGTGATSDDVMDVGASSARFDDVFATNGTIQTSDANEKQQIASLTDAEITAAKAISALFKTFKWKNKVESKGDAARIHSGVIAQEVQTAMSNVGLDAANYAFWCSDTWWETSTDVPAVEASEEVLDKFGTVTTQAVEAKDAYTRIDTYYKADEAPDGATQITRMGIRYPELLAFVGAATEQRLADIETRLTALEA